MPVEERCPALELRLQGGVGDGDVGEELLGHRLAQPPGLQLPGEVLRALADPAGVLRLDEPGRGREVRRRLARDPERGGQVLQAGQLDLVLEHPLGDLVPGCVRAHRLGRPGRLAMEVGVDHGLGVGRGDSGALHHGGDAGPARSAARAPAAEQGQAHDEGDDQGEGRRAAPAAHGRSPGGGLLRTRSPFPLWGRLRILHPQLSPQSLELGFIGKCGYEDLKLFIGVGDVAELQFQYGQALADIVAVRLLG